MRVVLAHSDLGASPWERQVLSGFERAWPTAAVTWIDNAPVAFELGQGDVVISTSVRAAQWVSVTGAGRHVVYVAPPSRREGDGSALSAGDRAARAVNDWTWIAATHQLERKLAQQTGAHAFVVAPPVSFPIQVASVRREMHFLCVHEEQTHAELELAIEACRQQGASLLIANVLDPRARQACERHQHVRCWGTTSLDLIRQQYLRCRAVIVPGAVSFSRAAVEAQAHGAPVVASAASGAAEVIVDCEEHAAGTGWLYSGETAASLFSTLREMARRPQSFEPALAIANASRYSFRRFEHEMQSLIGSLANTLSLSPAVPRPDTTSQPRAA